MSDNANNTAKYPRPPFVDQPQSPPGLAEEMKPQPDHGELSYVGSGRLAGKRALITGGDSGIGRAVAIACSPATPTPITNALAALTVPAAVIIIGKARP